MNQAAVQPGPATAAGTDDLARWIQAFFVRNMEIFDAALTDYGEEEVKSHLAELADWTADRLRRARPGSELTRFLDAAGDSYDLAWMRGQRGAEWGWVADRLLVDAPEHFHGTIMPKYGQGEEQVGITAGAGASR